MNNCVCVANVFLILHFWLLETIPLASTDYWKAYFLNRDSIFRLVFTERCAPIDCWLLLNLILLNVILERKQLIYQWECSSRRFEHLLFFCSRIFEIWRALFRHQLLLNRFFEMFSICWFKILYFMLRKIEAG